MGIAREAESSGIPWQPIVRRPQDRRAEDSDVVIAMPQGNNSTTSPTLLGRLAAVPPDQVAWAESL
jgi:hypothetical protein